MLKARKEIWVIIIILLICCKFGKNFYNNKIAEEEKINNASIVTADLNEFDIYTKNNLTNVYFDVDGIYYEIKPYENNPDFIITKDQIPKNGYIEFENYLFSPYVLMADRNIEYIDGTYEIKNNLYSIDLKKILLAIENEAEWDSITNGENVSIGWENPVKLKIIQNDDLNNIKEYFVLTLNEYNEPDKNKRVELEARVNKILEKCDITDNPVIGSYEGLCFSSEEILFKNGNVFKSGSFGLERKIAVPEKTIKTDYNLYVKNDKLQLVKKILQTPTFLDHFGIKNIDNNILNESEYYSYTSNTYNFISANVREGGTIATQSDVPENETSEEPDNQISETDETAEGEKNEGLYISTTFLLFFNLIAILFFVSALLKYMLYDIMN